MSVDFSDYRYVEPNIMMVGMLSCAVIENKDRDDNLRKAQEWSDKIFDPEHDAKRSSQSAILYRCLVDIFQSVLEAQTKDISTSLNSAKRYVAIILEDSATHDPIRSFALKTQILIEIVVGNYNSAARYVDRFLNFQGSEAKKQFCKKISYWLGESQRRKGRLFTIRESIFPEANDDPWDKVLQRFISEEMNKDLRTNISDSDSVVFVEGRVDKLVLNQFSRKAVPNKKIRFFDAEGYTNLVTMQKDANIVRELNIPLFFVFDGDTLTDPKKKEKRKNIEQRLMIDSKSSYTLQQDSIESYLLVSSSIKKAFSYMNIDYQEIESFINARKSKHNKKKVLDDLLKILKVGKLTPKRAELIAKEMNVADIPEDVVKILLAISR